MTGQGTSRAAALEAQGSGSSDFHLHIRGTRKSHSKCGFGCATAEGNLVQVKKEEGLSVLVSHCVVIPAGSRVSSSFE